MAWGGKYAGRMSMKQRSWFLRNSHRSLPKPENPHGVPKTVMKALAQERLSSDPIAFNVRLQQLLAAYKLNGGG